LGSTKLKALIDLFDEIVEEPLFNQLRWQSDARSIVFLTCNICWWREFSLHLSHGCSSTSKNLSFKMRLLVSSYSAHYKQIVLVLTFIMSDHQLNAWTFLLLSFKLILLWNSSEFRLLMIWLWNHLV
jgi:hypothetical protein